MNDKKIFWLVSIPRSGNTLFGSLMNQNPNICVTANSITLEILKDLFLLKTTHLFQNYPDEKSLDNVLDSVFDNYYKDWNYKYIIDRGPVTLSGNLQLMKKHFKQPIKCIVLCRNILDVLASYMKWYYNNSNAFVNRPEYNCKTDEEKLKLLMNKDGAIAKDLEAIITLLQPENLHMACFVKYDDLIADPRTQLNRIYNFLEIPYFEHNFNNLSQLNVNNRSYDDKIVGDNMHTIRTNGIYKEDNPYRSMIPKRIVDKYGHIKF